MIVCLPGRHSHWRTLTACMGQYANDDLVSILQKGQYSRSLPRVPIAECG